MYKWDNIKKDLYVNALSADEISHQLDMLSQTIDVAENTSDINDSLHSFCNVLGEVTSPLFKKNMFNNDMQNDRSNNQNKVPYFDNECKTIEEKLLYMFELLQKECL